MWQYTPYNFPLALTGLLSLVVAVYIWRHRNQPGAKPLCLLMVVIALWSLGAALEKAAVVLDAKMLWIGVLYFGVVSVPGAWFYFALQYSGRRIHLRNWTWLFIEPLVVLAVVWTPSLHKFYWSSIELVRDGDFTAVALTQGTGFWLHATYSYVLLLAGLVLLLRRFLRAHGPYKKQIGALMGISLVPWLANALYIFGLNPFPYLDLTPFAFAVTGLGSAWALFRFRLLDLAPVARDLLVEHMSYGVLVLDEQRRIVDVNPAARRLLPHPDEECIGRTVGSVLPELSRLLEGQVDLQRAELELVVGRICEVSLFVLQPGSRERTGYLIMLDDITEHKREEAEKEAARQMRDQIWSMEGTEDISRVQQSVYDVLMSLGLSFAHCSLNITYDKGRHFAVHGLDAKGQESGGAATAVGNDLLESVWRSGAPLYRADLLVDDPHDKRTGLAHAYQSEIRSIIDVPFSHGTLALNSTQPNAFSPEAIESLQMVAGLLSEAFRRWEDIRAREKNLAELQREVKEHRRTADELRAAKNIAEAATEAKGQFLANMSHEIRTPMNAVLGMTELLLNTSLNDEQLEYLKMVHESADGLLNLLNDLLDFSRADSGSLKLEEAPFVLKDCVEGVVGIIASQASGKDVMLDWHIAEEVGAYYRGDVSRLRQILLNLLGNAVKFTAEGGVTLDVKLEEMRHDGAVLRFAVTDTGIGIAAEKQQAIFEVFTQADASTTRRFGGTGLGLTICQQLVSMMDGKIWVDSEPGRGSTFFFTAHFRLLKDGEKPAIAPVVIAPAVPSPKLAAVPQRILLVEDMVPNQKVVTNALGKRGHQVVVASSGAEALMELEQDRAFDMVLMDLQMPGMGGIEAAEIIRAQEREKKLPELRIVALTGNALAGDREACLEVGMDDYLAKPFHIAELVALVEGEANVVEASQDTVPLTRENLLQGVNGDGELLGELVGMVFEARASSLAAIEEALEQGDCEMLEKSAHAYKGVLGVVGENIAFSAAAELEQQARTGNIERAPVLFENLQVAVDQFEVALRDIIS